ncbi:symmetrical bis(5'-nucleosyl)-tetraphosphatase [Magnetococcales bacterium HHB-1]
MATYVISDVHGCYDPLQQLLKRIRFNLEKDTLWFIGDLINRGPDSIKVLQFVKNLGSRAITIMGNHEAWALGGLSGQQSPLFQHYAEKLLDHPERDLWCQWIAERPLMHHDEQLGYTMVHAGLPPQWNIPTALGHAKKAEQILKNPLKRQQLFQSVEDRLPSTPPQTDQNALIWFHVAIFTRIRLCHADGRILWPQRFRYNSQDEVDEEQFKPWYQLRAHNPDEKILYGHWAIQRLMMRKQTFGIDSGCVYGGAITAIRLDDPMQPIYQVPCDPYSDTD